MTAAEMAALLVEHLERMNASHRVAAANAIVAAAVPYTDHPYTSPDEWLSAMHNATSAYWARVTERSKHDRASAEVAGLRALRRAIKEAAT